MIQSNLLLYAFLLGQCSIGLLWLAIYFNNHVCHFKLNLPWHYWVKVHIGYVQGIKKSQAPMFRSGTVRRKVFSIFGYGIAFMWSEKK